MTGLKSGSGDDLWGDEGDDQEEEEVVGQESTQKEADEPEEATETEQSDTEGATEDAQEVDATPPDTGDGAVMESPKQHQQPYIVRRAVQDKSVQFERDDRLTFFVHEDVVDGERELLLEAEAALGRDVPKFDVREAVYRAALRNKEDVIAELVKMGYSTSE